MNKNNNTPKQIFKEYQAGVTYKGNMGEKGLYEQSKRNERFYVGDQWHGAKCGSDRPLVRHNVIKRIGDYKQSFIVSAPVSVSFTAEGVSSLSNKGEQYSSLRRQMPSLIEGGLDPFAQMSDAERTDFVVGTLGDYCNTTMERLRFNEIKDLALRKAYISGTAILHTYWDEDVVTGLYADAERTKALKGDICCELIDVENFYVGDVTARDIQSQPYIIIEQRVSVQKIKEQMKLNGRPSEEIESVKADNDTDSLAGDYGSKALDEDKKCTLLTKFYKVKEGGKTRVKALKVCKNATVREEWDCGVDVYPFSAFCWEQRSNCFYGESEVTWLIPNQIAINRMLTAAVWAVMINGMPILVKDMDAIPQDISNDPGQIINAVSLNGNGVAGALQYVTPPAFYAQFDNMAQSIIGNTLTQSGANDAALGDIVPDNTSAILAVREAATMPMQMFKNRFYQFIEDTVRVWASFWVNMYGNRSLKITDRQGVWYLPFNSKDYADTMLSVKVDVGASTLWSEAQSISILDSLFDRKVIDIMQYLERLPKGIVPDVSGLMEDLRQKDAPISEENSSFTTEELLQGLPTEIREQFEFLPSEKQEEILAKAIGKVGAI